MTPFRPVPPPTWAPAPPPLRSIPRECFGSCRRHSVRPTDWILVVRVQIQRMDLFQRIDGTTVSIPSPRSFRWRQRFLISTSRHGVGQKEGSLRTPLGLHRVSRKVGAGHPIGTVFRHRQPTGYTWQGQPDAPIAHRILWLEGLQPGFNQGGDVDTRSRYIYIHGLGDEPTLGRPSSQGCIHLAARDLMPFFDACPVGTLVWIGLR